MKRHIKTALLGIFLLSSVAATASAQHSIFQTIHTQGMPAQISNGIRGSIGLNQIPGTNPSRHTDMRYRRPNTLIGTPTLPQGSTHTDLLYRGNNPGSWGGVNPVNSGIGVTPQPVTDMRYRGPNPITGVSPIPQGTPVTDTMYRGPITMPQPTPVTDMRYRGPTNPGVTPNPGGMMPNLPIQGGSIGIPGTQHQFNPINGIKQGIQTIQPQNTNLLSYNRRENIVGGTYNDGHGGTIRGSIDGVLEGNVDAGFDSQFAGVRGEVRGGIEAQGRTEIVHDINGMPVNQYVSGNVFLGTEAQAQAGLSREGLGVGAGGFAGARAQMTRGLDLGAVDVSQTIEAQVGVGAEANAHLGLQDGRFRINGELGAAVGIGAKVGMDAEVDLGATGRFVERTGNGAIRTGGAVARDVDRWGNQAGRDISRTTNNASNSVKRTVNKTGNDVKKTANKVGGGIKKFGNSLFGK